MLYQKGGSKFHSQTLLAFNGVLDLIWCPYKSKAYMNQPAKHTLYVHSGITTSSTTSITWRYLFYLGMIPILSWTPFPFENNKLSRC